MNRAYLYAYNKKDIPTREHYAILEFTSIHVPGDERSRTYPGHGYEEHTEQTINYLVFEDRMSWEAEIQRRKEAQHDRGNWLPIVCKPAQISVEVNVKIT